ncbi:MAG TPA: hypothetical protein VI653_11935, partial [Steroidobacteraceae bacterium]
MAVLRNHVRSDIGRFPSFSTEAEQSLKTLYAQHPTWNAQLLHDNLRVILEAASRDTCPSYPSVRRYLKAHGLVRKSPLLRGYVSNGMDAPTRQRHRYARVEVSSTTRTRRASAMKITTVGIDLAKNIF